MAEGREDALQFLDVRSFSPSLSDELFESVRQNQAPGFWRHW